jgi:hypothetical protein
MNDRTGKLGIIAALVIPALVFLASCEVPQSVRVKASPTYHIPIPLGSEGISNSFIRPYTDVEEIRKTLRDGAEEGKAIGVYKYAASEDESAAFMDHLAIPAEEDAPVQTYLLSYPIFNINLDLMEYINRAGPDGRNVPSMSISSDVAKYLQEVSSLYIYNGGELPYELWVDPFEGDGPVVDLGDLKSLVSNICFNDGVSFKIKIPPGNVEKAEQLEKAIRVRAPQLKFGYSYNSPDAWVKGTLNSAKTELEFSSNRKDEINQTGNSAADALLLNGDPRNDKVNIDIRLVNVAGIDEYETELNFDWYSMDVSPESGQTGEFAGFNLGSYLKELGSGAVFLKVAASLYMHIPEGLEGLTVTLTDRAGTELSGSEGTTVPNQSYIIPPAGEALPSWLEYAPVKYDFEETLNTGRVIRYTINPPNAVTILRRDVDQWQDTTINAHLVVILPMAFRFPADSESLYIDAGDGEGEKKYLAIGFRGMDEFLSGDDSAMTQIDDQLGQGGIDGLTLNLSDIKNKIISSFFLAIEKDPSQSGSDNWHLVKIADGEGGSFSIDNAASLAQFPRIKFLIPADQDGDGTLYIKAQAAGDTTAFDVKISAQADINLDSELKF